MESRERKRKSSSPMDEESGTAAMPHPVLAQDWFARRLVRVTGSLRTLQSAAATNRQLGSAIDSALECLLRLDIPPSARPLPTSRALCVLSSQRGQMAHLGGLGVPEAYQTAVRRLSSLHLHLLHDKVPSATYNAALFPALLLRNADTLRRLVVCPLPDQPQSCFTMFPFCQTISVVATNVATLRIPNLDRQDSEFVLQALRRESIESLTFSVSATPDLLPFLLCSNFESLCRLGIPLCLLPLAAKLPKLQSLRLVVGFEWDASYDLRALHGLRHLCFDLTEMVGGGTPFPVFQLHGLRLEFLELRLPKRPKKSRLSALYTVTAPVHLGLVGPWAAALLAAQPSLPRLSVRCAGDYARQVGLGSLPFAGALRLVLAADRASSDSDLELPANLRRLQVEVWSVGSAPYIRLPELGELESLSLSAGILKSGVKLGRLPALKTWRLGRTSGEGINNFYKSYLSLNAR